MNARHAPALIAAAPPGYDAAPAITLTRAGRAALDLSSAASAVLAAWDAPRQGHDALVAAMAAPIGALRTAQRRAVAS